MIKKYSPVIKFHNDYGAYATVEKDHNGEYITERRFYILTLYKQKRKTCL